MSKLLEKKDIIHIATEIVVFIGITFYFSSKNKKLLEHIEDLSKRLEEQEDIVQKHEKIIIQLVQTINNPRGVGQGVGVYKHQPRQQHITPSCSLIKTNKKINSLPKVSFKKNQAQDEDNDEEEDDDDDDDDDEYETQAFVENESELDSDLDKEIAEELKELQ